METLEYRGHTIKINNDTCLDSPREWDNLGTMYFFHRRYDLGDKHNFNSPEDLQENITGKTHLILPVYMYDHSGITINTTGFSCRWDSGQLGIIAVSKEKIRKEFSAKIISKKLKERVYKLLDGEVKTYDQFLRGDVYYYVTEDAEENSIDSCGGFYGLDDCITGAKESIDYNVKRCGEQLALSL